MAKMTKTQIMKLLTPELHEKVVAKTKELIAKAEKHFDKKLKMPEIRYDIKNWDVGRAYMPSNVIRYNLILLVENEEHFIANVVPHEVAHNVNRMVNKPAPGKKRLMPHGKEWKSIMKDVFDVEPSVKHSYDVSSIQKSPRRAQSKRARVDNAIHVVSSVLKRVETKFTAEERLRFKRAIAPLMEQVGLEMAA